MDRDPIKEVQQRTLRYWYIDGTFEFSIGGICLLLSLYFFLLSQFAGTWLSDLLNVLLILVIIAGGAFVNWMVRKLKERVTYPRTGYVKYRRETGKRRLAVKMLIGMVSGFVAALVTLGLVWLSRNLIIDFTRSSPRPISWMPAITGLMFSLVYVYLAIRNKSPRHLIVSLLSILIGVGLMFSNLDNNLVLTAFYGLLGILLFVIGLLTLRRYLQTAPQPQEDADGSNE